jgi:glycosyltransferase involved in cell wall biosynthesis
MLFVCNDVVGTSMAGPGIRYWELAHALARRGQQAVILSKHLEKGFSSNALAFVGKSSFFNLATWLYRSDFVVQSGRPLPVLLSVLFRKKIIFDQYDPVIFEFLERKPRTWPGKFANRTMLFLWNIRQRIILRFGHGFLVANEKQKDLLIGQMTILGHTKKIAFICLLPFGLPSVQPVKNGSVLRGTKIKDTDFLLVWGGGIWDWFDPFTLLRAMAKIRSRRDDIKLFFPGIKPPSPDSQKMTVAKEFMDEARALGLLDETVFINPGWYPYDRRADYLLEADAGIILHRDSLETRFAFRTRMLDYLWAGLPIISSRGDSWADLIEKNGLGTTVSCGDVDDVVKAITRMAEDRVYRERCREQVRKITADYTWDGLVSRLPL